MTHRSTATTPAFARPARSASRSLLARQRGAHRRRRRLLAPRHVDDMIDVFGHGISTIEVESALINHERVANSRLRPLGRDHRTAITSPTWRVKDDGLGGDSGNSRPRRAQDRRDGEAGEHDLRARLDPLGKDHSPPAARRHGREPATQRHDDAGRPSSHRHRRARLRTPRVNMDTVSDVRRTRAVELGGAPRERSDIRSTSSSVAHHPGAEADRRRPFHVVAPSMPRHRPARRAGVPSSRRRRSGRGPGPR